MSTKPDADDVRNEVMDVAKDVQELQMHLSDAQCCETNKDLVANIEDAREAAKLILEQLNSMLKAAKELE